MPIDPRQAGQEIRRVRLAAGLTQIQLAALAGLDQSNLSLLERGGRVPKIATLGRWAEALGCSVLIDPVHGVRLVPADSIEIPEPD